jgi:hypothetical protein
MYVWGQDLSVGDDRKMNIKNYCYAYTEVKLTDKEVEIKCSKLSKQTKSMNSNT